MHFYFILFFYLKNWISELIKVVVALKNLKEYTTNNDNNKKYNAHFAGCHSAKAFEVKEINGFEWIFFQCWKRFFAFVH